MLKGASGERIPVPKNIEAERAVLGACLQDSSCIGAVKKFVKSEYFYSNAHRILWDTMNEQIERGPLDIITLHDAFERNHTLENVGGAVVIAELFDDMYSVVNAEYYAKLVWKTAIRRMMLVHAYEMGTEVNKVHELRDLVGHYVEAMRDVSEELGREEGVVDIVGSAADVIAEYENAKICQGVDGISTGWLTLDRVTGGFHPGEIITVVARLGVGKCVAEGTLLVNPKTGIRTPVEKMIEARENVLTFDTKKPFVRSTTPSHWIQTGEKEGIRIKTRLGHDLAATPEHPMLTSGGNVRLDALGVGDCVVAVARIPEPEEPVRRDEAKIDLLAVLLSEGSLTGHHVGFSTSEEKYVDFVRDAAEKRGLEVKPRSGYDYDLVPQKIARDILHEFGAGLVKSVEKRVPESVFSLPNDQLARFMWVFWWGDGGKDGCVGLGSEGLIDDLQHLLLRFGVVARKRYKPVTCEGKAFDSWELRVESWTRGRFRNLMAPMPGEKGDALRELKDPENPNTDNVPVTDEMVDLIYSAAEKYRKWDCCVGERKGLFADTARALGRNPRQIGIRDFVDKNGKRSVGRKALRALIETAGGLLSEIAWMVSEDIAFVDVKSIERCGVKQMYDLTIPETHLFVAANLVVHNTWLETLFLKRSWEQDERSLFISLEMDPTQIRKRFFAMVAKLSYSDFRMGRLGDLQEPKIAEAVEYIKGRNRPIHVIGADLVEKVNDIDAYIDGLNPSILFVDGFYLLEEDKKADLWAATTKVIRRLKRVASRRKIPIVLTSQFNRSAAKKGGQGEAEDIGFTDAIGQTSDVVISLVRDEDMERNRQMKIRCLKNREGVRVEFMVDWDLDKMKFDEGEADEEEIEEDVPF